MIPNLENLAQLGSTVLVVLIFIWYLKEQGKLFNQTINNHLEHSLKTIDKNSEVITKVAVAMKELCLVIKKTNKGERGDRGPTGPAGIQGEEGKSRTTKLEIK